MAFDKKNLKEKYKGAVVTPELLDQVEYALGFQEVYVPFGNKDYLKDDYLSYINKTPIWCQMTLLNIIKADHGICFSKQMPKIVLHCIGVTYHIRGLYTRRIGNFYNAINCFDMAIKKGCKDSYSFLCRSYDLLAELHMLVDISNEYFSKYERYRKLAIKHGNFFQNNRIHRDAYSHEFKKYIKSAIRCKNIKKPETDIIANVMSHNLSYKSIYASDIEIYKQLVINRVKTKKILAEQDTLITELNKC